MLNPFGFPPWLERRIDALLPGPSATRAARTRPEQPRIQLPAPSPPAAPVRPKPPPVPCVPVRLRRPVEKAAPVREGQPAHSVHGRTPSANEGESGPLMVAVQQPGQAGARGEESACSLALEAGLAPQDEQEAALMSALLAQAHESGVFEVLLPDGATLGVAVDVRPGAVDYLLTPATERLAAQLRGRQMELAGLLEQRIGRSVRLTVL